MKTTLQLGLAKIAPYIAIQTIWEHDGDSGPISSECDGFDASEDCDWQAWQSCINCTAIVEGVGLEGNEYLGRTFEKAGDLPGSSNPTVSGYEPQMTIEALRELGYQISDEVLSNQIINAIKHCEKVMNQA